MAADALNQDFAKLKADIDRLREDLASLASSIKEYGGERGRETVEKAKRAEERLRQHAADAEARLEHEIGAHPFTSVLTSFGVGFLLGILLDRRR